jgi:enoyl-CoA hydratase
MKFKFIEYKTYDQVAVLSLNDPPANTLTYDLTVQLEEVYLEALLDPKVRAIVITGSGERFFSGGVNIGMLSNASHHYNSNFLVYAAEVFERIAQSPLLVVAAINGHITGGGLELALVADRRIAAEGNYNIGFPEVRLGVIPGLGGTQRLTKIVGNRLALELITQGRFISVTEAKSIGVVDELFPQSEFLSNAIAYTKMLLQRGELASRPTMTNGPWQPPSREIIEYSLINRIGVITVTQACQNVSSMQALWALNQAILNARLDEEVDVLLLTHEGAALRLGADDQYDGITWEYADFIFRRLEDLPRLCILAFSGSLDPLSAELALACDYRFTPEREAMQDLSISISGKSPRRVRYKLDERLHGSPGLLTLNGLQAVNVGLVKYTGTTDWLQWVMNWSARFVPPAGASLSIGYAKLAIVKGSSFPLEAGMLLERHLQEQLFRSHDGPEGMKAYLEKRSAVFTGE